MPHYNRCLLELDEEESQTQDLEVHPITDSFERMDAVQSYKVEVISARYVVGCNRGGSTVCHKFTIPVEVIFLKMHEY